MVSALVESNRRSTSPNERPIEAFTANWPGPVIEFSRVAPQPRRGRRVRRRVQEATRRSRINRRSGVIRPKAARHAGIPHRR